MAELDIRALTRALQNLDHTIKKDTNRIIKDLVRVTEALNRNLVEHGRMMKDLVGDTEALNRNFVELGRMMKQKDEVENVQDVSSEGL
jgi:hypothetical protein